MCVGMVHSSPVVLADSRLAGIWFQCVAMALQGAGHAGNEYKIS